MHVQISPPNMYARPAITERECEERGREGASMRFHCAFIGCVFANMPLTAATPVAAICIIFAIWYNKLKVGVS